MEALNSLPLSTLPGSPRDRFHADAASARWRLERWILHGGMQIASGPHAGGVCGAVNLGGRPLYVYPEITGYFLQWLASRASRADATPDLRARARAAQDWLAAWAADGERALTRVHLDGDRADWRNDARFCFDLAIGLRGVAAAAEQRLIEPSPALIRHLGTMLCTLVGDDGLLQACVARDAATELPEKWSTRRGPFLAKAANGILRAARAFALPSVLTDAAVATFRAAHAWCETDPHLDTHPFLYAVEGILFEPPIEPGRATVDALAAQYAHIVRTTRAAGFVPESPGNHEVRRVDIVAQSIRAVMMLEARDVAVTDPASVIAMLAHQLVANIDGHGGVLHDRHRIPHRYNGWAALFAEQALAWIDTPHDDDACAREHLV